MKVEFDPAKDAVNLAKHGLSLEAATRFVQLYVEQDERRAYPEVRYRAFGLLDGLPHCMAFTIRGEITRILSLRRAHTKEFGRYVA